MAAPVEEERLLAYVDGELDQPETRRMEAEIAADSALARSVAESRAEAATIRAAYQEALRAEVPDALVAAIDSAFAAREAASRRPATRAAWWQPATGAVAASIVAVVVGLAGAYYFAERGVEREMARLEAIRSTDVRMIEAAVSGALEKHVSGAPAQWHNPRSGSRGTVEPIRTFKISSGQWCREYVHVVEFHDWRERRETRRVVACREPDGRWKKRLRVGEES